MKITIKPENDEDAKYLPTPVVFEHVFEYALVGRLQTPVSEAPFSRSHYVDRFILHGKLAELQERLRDTCITRKPETDEEATDEHPSSG